MRRMLFARLDVAGVVLGLLSVAGSLTPSLLPRPSWGQGLVSGLSFAIGYGCGVLLWRIVRLVSRGRVPHDGQATGWVVMCIGVAGVMVIMPFAVDWQNSVRESVGMPATTAPGWLLVGAFALVGMWLGFAIGRGVGRAYRALRRLALRMFGTRIDAPRRRAVATSATAVVALLACFSIAVPLLSLLLTWAYEVRNGNYDPEYAQPTSPLKSGSPESLVAWEELGQAGVKIVAGGPDQAQIAAVTGMEAMEPIRIYVGIDVPGSHAERAQVAVQELERTGAAERDFLMVASTTGTGWLDAAAIDSFDYLHAGNTALVTMQYGATPSPVSAILTPDLSQVGTQALFEAVYAWWEELPEDDRPELIAYGLSLGSFGMNSVFSSPEDLTARTDGAVLAGTPSFTALWKELQDSRDESSPYALPVLNAGEQFRWEAKWGDLAALGEQWDEPRVAYLQHGNDPIVWIGPSVIWQEPEWLKPGQRSDVVSKDMVWIPVVTALQGVVDLIGSQAVPENSGHRYGDVALDALREVSGDAGLSDEAFARVRTVIESYDTFSPVSR